MEPKEIKRYVRTIEHLASSGLLEPAIKADVLVRKLNSTPITEQQEIQILLRNSLEQQVPVLIYLSSIIFNGQ